MFHCTYNVKDLSSGRTEHYPSIEAFTKDWDEWFGRPIHMNELRTLQLASANLLILEHDCLGITIRYDDIEITIAYHND